MGPLEDEKKLVAVTVPSVPTFPLASKLIRSVVPVLVNASKVPATPLTVAVPEVMLVYVEDVPLLNLSASVDP